MILSNGKELKIRLDFIISFLCVCFLHEGDASHFTNIVVILIIHAYAMFIFLENTLSYFIYFAVVTGLIEFTELNQFSYPLIYLLEFQNFQKKNVIALKIISMNVREVNLGTRITSTQISSFHSIPN